MFNYLHAVQIQNSYLQCKKKIVLIKYSLKGVRDI